MNARTLHTRDGRTVVVNLDAVAYMQAVPASESTIEEAHTRLIFGHGLPALDVVESVGLILGEV